MKKIYILILVILYLPNNSFAQISERSIPGMRDPYWGHDPWTVMAHGKTSPHLIIPRTESLLSRNTTQYRFERKNRYTMIYYRYAAESVTDETTGMTTITWEDGAKYYGQTYFGEIRGIGTIIYPDSSRYCGEWKKDQPNGKGSFISPEGVVFTGKFKDGVPHGKCIMQSPDGKLYKARWVRGVLKEKSIKPLKEE